MIRWLRRKHPRLTWKQARRRYYGADRITQNGVTLYNPARIEVGRYRYRGAQICTPYNIDEVDPGRSTLPPHRPRRRCLSSASSLNSSALHTRLTRGEPDARERARPVRRAGTGRPTNQSWQGVLSPTQLAPLDATGTQLLFRFVAAAYERRALGVASHWAFNDWGRFLPEHTTTASLLDRLLHHAVIILTDGDSYRMRTRRGGPTP